MHVDTVHSDCHTPGARQLSSALLLISHDCGLQLVVSHHTPQLFFTHIQSMCCPCAGGHITSFVTSKCCCWWILPTTTDLPGTTLLAAAQGMLLQLLRLTTPMQQPSSSGSSSRLLSPAAWGQGTAAACLCTTSTARLCASSPLQLALTHPATARAAPACWLRTHGWTPTRLQAQAKVLQWVPLGGNMGCQWCCQQCWLLLVSALTCGRRTRPLCSAVISMPVCGATWRT